MITTLTLLPLIGAILVACIPRARTTLARAVAFSVTLAVLAMALTLWARFDSTSASLQVVERHIWAPSLGAEYFVGIAANPNTGSV